jgi:hypothetical protein
MSSLFNFIFGSLYTLPLLQPKMKNGFLLSPLPLSDFSITIVNPAFEATFLHHSISLSLSLDSAALKNRLLVLTEIPGAAHASTMPSSTAFAWEMPGATYTAYVTMGATTTSLPMSGSSLCSFN